MKNIKFIIVAAFLFLLFANSAKAQNTSPWAVQFSFSPLITNLTSNEFKSEETPVVGSNFVGDIDYNFLQSGKFGINVSLGLGISTYINMRKKTNYTNQLWTSEYEDAVNGIQNFQLTETANNMRETDKMTFLDIPFKLGFHYDFSPKWAVYANVGVTYGINLHAVYHNFATITRTGYYPEYNVLLYDIEVPGSPFYYPVNKASFGSGNISARNNWSGEGTLGAKYDTSEKLSFFAGVEMMRGFSNVKNNPSSFILAPGANSLNTLLNRSDVVKTTAYGLEFGAQFKLGK